LSSIRKGERVTQKPSEDIGLSDIWKFLVRRRLIVAAGVIAGCAIGLLMYARAPRLYTATAMVEMSPQGNGLEELAGASGLVGEGSEFMTDMLTQQAVLMDESTALSVIQRLNLMDTPPYSALIRGRSESAATALRQDNVVMDRALGIFRGGLKTVPITNTRLLAVSYTDRDPARAAAIANAVVEAFLENHTKSRYDATVKASSWLTDQLDALRRRAEDIHEQVARLERKSGVLTMPVPAGQPGVGGGGSESINSNPEYQRLAALNDELGRAEIARIEKEAVYRLAQTNDSDAILGLSGTQLLADSGGALDPRSSSMQALHSLRTEEEGLKVRLAAEQVRHGVRNPIIVEIQKQIAAIEAQISDELARMNAEAKADYLLAKANEDALRQDVDATKAHLMSLGDDLSTLIFLRDEEATSRKLYEDLYTRLEEANITAGVNSSGMTIDVAARVPSGTSSPVLRNYLVGGLGGGLFAGILIGLLVQAADTLLYSPEDFERFSPYPLLGIIPAFQSVPGVEPRALELLEPGGDKEAWIVRAPKSQIAEGYRQIRTSIMLSSVDRQPHVLLVTSAFSGDGKTTTAYNLAAAFATQSTKVLLIGADMRHPSIPVIPGFGMGKGLSDVLSQGIQLEEVLQPHPSLPALHILHAGTIPPDPAELLGSKRFAELMKKLREAYDYIIIDAPPVIPVTDPVIAGTAADAIVTVVRSGQTRKPDLKEMWAALNKPGITILGFMVNGYRGQLRSYRYEYDQKPERPRSRWRK
jgi:polysaccharide biosynthesis transport protein